MSSRENCRLTSGTQPARPEVSVWGEPVTRAEAGGVAHAPAAARPGAAPLARSFGHRSAPRPRTAPGLGAPRVEWGERAPQRTQWPRALDSRSRGRRGGDRGRGAPTRRPRRRPLRGVDGALGRTRHPGRFSLPGVPTRDLAARGVALPGGLGGSVVSAAGRCCARLRAWAAAGAPDLLSISCWGLCSGLGCPPAVFSPVWWEAGGVGAGGRARGKKYFWGRPGQPT